MDIPPLDRLLACDEIRNLVARYAIATDARDLDTLVSLFVDDVNVGRLGTGRDALRASFDQALRGIGRSFLFVGTQTDPVLPIGQKFFIPAQITDPGILLVLQNSVPIVRQPSTRETFEFVVTF